jgi:hypothetical protein
MMHEFHYSIKELDEKLKSYQSTTDQVQKAFNQWFFLLNDCRLKYKTHRDSVVEKKERVSISPQIRKALETIQHLEHEKTLGQFERLLEAILDDILPNYNFKVKLVLKVSNRVPSLDFWLATHGSDQWEDAWKYNGGAAADAFSLGLRFISIIRSGQRRFLLIDEGDAWTSSESVSRYIKVIQQLCWDFGFQALVITHHPDILLETDEDVPVYRVSKYSQNDPLSHVQLEPGKMEPVWNDDEVGIRSIALENFLSHEETKIILSPAMTVIVGLNNSGKSVIAHALGAIVRNDSDELQIQHYKKEFSVSVEIENKLVVKMRRTKNAEKGYKVFYTLSDVKGNILKSSQGNDTPDWLDLNFKMNITENMEDLDPFLLTQKDRVFLLNKPRTKRSQVLAIQSDDDVLQSMFKLENSKISKLKTEIDAGEKILHYFHQTIEAISKYEKQLDNNPLFSQLNDLKKELSDISSLFDLYTNWDSLKSKEQIYNKYDDLLNNDIELNEDFNLKISFIEEYLVLLKNWVSSNKRENVYSKHVDSDEISVPESQDIEQMESLLNLCKNWMFSQQKEDSFNRYFSNVQDIDDLDLTYSDEGIDLYQKWIQYLSVEDKAVEDIKKEDKIMHDIEKEQAKIKVCPLCETPLEHGFGLEHHHD